jgi:flagellar hook-associated protein 1 FlgK
MPSTFFGLTIAYTGLQAANTSLNVAGHNISNINTDGYTKQQATVQAADAIRTYNRSGTLGSGVTVTEITQLRDSYYDAKYRNNMANYGEYSSKQNYMTQIEDYLNEFTLEGFNTEFENFYSAVNQLTLTPGDASSKNQLINNAKSLADYFNTLSSNLRNIQLDANSEIKDTVQQINAYAKNLAALNKQINQIEAYGSNANDLRDQRNALIDELSELVNVDVTEQELGNNLTYFQVRINGQSLVAGNDYQTLECVAREDPRNASDADGLYDIYWASGQEFNMYSSSLGGELRALIDVRDGNNGEIEYATTETYDDYPDQTVLVSSTKDDNGNALASSNTDYKGIPYYQSRLNEFITTFATEVNKILTGYEKTATKDPTTGETTYTYTSTTYTSDGLNTGTPLFVAKVDSMSLSAGNITVSEALLDDPDLLAIKESIATGEANATVMEKLNKLQSQKIFDGGTASYYLESIISDMSIDAQKANSLYTNYNNLKTTIQNQRLSVMGVDTDEEAMDLVKYQQAYNLNSKMLSVMNEIYDRLINNTGV